MRGIDSNREIGSGVTPPLTKPVLRSRGNTSLRVGITMLSLVLAVILVGPLFIEHEWGQTGVGIPLSSPDGDHLLGTDHLGRDLLARTIAGARITLLYTIGTLAIAAIVASIIGGAAAYFGGRLDLVVSFVVDSLFAFPDLLLAIFIIAALGPGLGNALIAVGVGAVPTFARMARGLVLGVKNEEYVTAARALGGSHLHILFRHIVPNCSATLIAFATLRYASVVLTVATLSFLGLGAQPPTPELGSLVAEGRTYIRSHPHAALLPGFVLGYIVLSLNIFGDGLNDLVARHDR